MVWSEIPEVAIYSDGGAEPNPGKGGFGVIMSYKGIKKEFSQGYVLTTNNRMELMGVIFGLERLKTKSIVNVFSDSQYVINGIEKGWAQKWKSKNWYRSKSTKAINFDLWDRLLSIIATHENVTFNWVKGHAGHVENERCDELALSALRSNDLLIDSGYEPNIPLNEYPEPLSSDKSASNIKVKEEGDLCRKCNTKVIRRESKKKPTKPGQTYYFDYYLFCPGCNTMYMVEDAKREIKTNEDELFN
jgi:ribonuclease HI